MEEKLLTVAEAASKLNVSPRTIQRYCNQGRLAFKWVMGARHRELRIVSPIPLTQLPGARRKNVAGSFDYVSKEDYDETIRGLKTELAEKERRITVLERKLDSTGVSAPSEPVDRIYAFMRELERIRPAEQKLILKLAREMQEHEQYLVSLGMTPPAPAGRDEQ